MTEEVGEGRVNKTFKTKTPSVSPEKVFEDIQKQNVAGVMKYLDDGGDANAVMITDSKTDVGYSIIQYVYECFEKEKDLVSITARFLLEVGISVDTEISVCPSKRLLEFAVAFQDEFIFNILIQNGVTVKSPFGNPFLERAIECGFQHRVRALIHLGADPNEFQDLSMLLYACQAGNPEIVKILLDNGANPNVADSGTYYHPIFTAIRENRTRIAEMFVKAGMDVNLERCELTPLIVAAQNDRVSELELLIQAGAEVNRQNCEKKTALHYAVKAGNINSCKVLAAHGADLNLVDSVGRTPLQVAAHNYRCEVAEFLIKKGAKDREVPRDRANAWTFARERYPIMYQKMKRSLAPEVDSFAMHQ